jgi:PhnB protein
MVSGEWEAGGVYSPEKYGGTPCSICLLVADVDALAARAVAAGATIERPPNDEPYGHRSCWLRDPFGTAGTSRRRSRMCPRRSCAAGWETAT